MGQPGFTTMIEYLFGDNSETVAAHNSAVGKTIKSIAIDDDHLRVSFDDETGIEFWDAGQSCCEHRYMSCDDDLVSFAGDKFVKAELREGPNKEGEYGDETECQFLVIQTDKGSFTVANYNSHNGYYGGFVVKARSFKAAA